MIAKFDLIRRWEPGINAALLYSVKNRKLMILDPQKDSPLARQIFPQEPPAPGTLSAPLKVFFGITRACDLDCGFCFARGGHYGRSLGTQTIIKVIREAADMGVFEFRLTGGEPTVHHDFFQIVELIDELGMNVSLNTHGAYDPDMLARIIASPVDDVRVSIDGPEDVHDLLRGRGVFQRALNTTRKLRDVGKKVRLNTMVFQGNRDVLDEMAKLAVDLGVPVRFCPMRPIGRARNPAFAERHVLSTDEWRQIEDDLAERGLFRKNISCFSIEDLEDFSQCPGMATGLEEALCSPWITQMGIDPEGDTYAGGRIDDIDKSLSVGSVADQPLVVLWKRAVQDVAQRVLPRFANCAKCSSVQMWQVWIEQLKRPAQSSHLY
jgi:MoaA/NifB/PqqE/SkfB family radical SAM enzyme